MSDMVPQSLFSSLTNATLSEICRYLSSNTSHLFPLIAAIKAFNTRCSSLCFQVVVVIHSSELLMMSAVRSRYFSEYRTTAWSRKRTVLSLGVDVPQPCEQTRTQPASQFEQPLIDYLTRGQRQRFSCFIQSEDQTHLEIKA